MTYAPAPYGRDWTAADHAEMWRNRAARLRAYALRHILATHRAGYEADAKEADRMAAMWQSEAA